MLRARFEAKLWAAACLLVAANVALISPTSLAINTANKNNYNNNNNEDEPEKDNNNNHNNNNTNKMANIDKQMANLLDIMGVNSVPKKAKQITVPWPILQEYVNQRNSSSDSIPLDSDYFGQIDLNNMHAIEGKNLTIDLDDEFIKQPQNYRYTGHHSLTTALRPVGEPFMFSVKSELNMPPRDSRLKPYRSVVLKFNLSQAIGSSQSPNGPIEPADLRGAELHIHREPMPPCNLDEFQPAGRYSKREIGPLEELPALTTKSTCYRPRKQRVLLLEVNGWTVVDVPKANVMDSQHIDTSTSYTLVFDVGTLVKRWLQEPNKLHELLIRVTNEDEPNSATVDIDPDQTQKVVDHVRLTRYFNSHSENDQTWNNKKPTIIIYSEPQIGDNTRKRHVKRDHSPTRGQRASRARTKSAPREGNKCSLRQLPMNFAEVGWSDWIIAPRSYPANYCYGDCSFPLPDHQNATNQAIIQSIYHSAGLDVPKPCCVPTKMSPLTLLYQLDDSIVQVRRYEDMIVVECGCQ